MWYEQTGFDTTTVCSGTVTVVTKLRRITWKSAKIQRSCDDTYQVQVVSWYDNENSYTSQMVRTIKYFAENC
ncbi:hypothetical protein DW816_03565 [Faecalibacterium prausnitzii]|nr:hypothetical protein DW816_03565 [Faecalibacterium prausnitzii]